MFGSNLASREEVTESVVGGLEPQVLDRRDEAKRNAAAPQNEIDAVEEWPRNLASTEELQIRRDKLISDNHAFQFRRTDARPAMLAVFSQTE